MTVIRVNPQSVRNYGTSAQSCFDEMRDALVQAVDQVATVHYFGPNATSFKQQSGALAASFANQLSQSMQSMASAVQASTSSIASSLGGAPVSIAVQTTQITPPDVATVDYVDLDTSALEALKPQIAARFSALQAGLDRNLAALSGTDWTGNAKDTAVQQVKAYTTKSKQSCDEAQRSLQQFIDNQLSSAIAADR